MRGSRFTDKLHFKYRADRFKNDDGKLVSIKRPRIEVIFRKFSEHADPKENPEFWTHALVDSGADICFIPRAIANVLRLEVDEESKKSTTGAGGKFTTYRLKMYLEILYKGQRVGIDTVDVAFPERDPDGVELERNILVGRSGLFTKYQITFNDKQKTIDFKKIN